MFSDHLNIIDKTPNKKLFLVAAGLVLVCQLVAMALVAGGQVEKAQLRQASQASFQTAMASCVANNRGMDLKDCARLLSPGSTQANADQLAGKTGTSSGMDSQGFTLVNLANRY